jgi:transcriptional regulator with XRE-family HTH domain
MTEFQNWIIEVINTYAHGSHQTLAAKLDVRRSTVSAWVTGDNAPSIISAKKLEQLTKLDWRKIGAMANSRFTHGVGNHLRDQAGEVKLPAPEATNQLDEVAWPALFEGCTACHDSRTANALHSERRKVCQGLIRANLPGLCEPWDWSAVTAMVEKVIKDD